MKNIIASLALALMALLATTGRALADSGTTTRCYTNAYGQETCTTEEWENPENETQERVIVKEKQVVTTTDNQEVVTTTTIVEHQTLDTALTTGQTVTLMAAMAAGLGAVGYKLRRSLVTDENEE